MNALELTSPIEAGSVISESMFRATIAASSRSAAFSSRSFETSSQFGHLCAVFDITKSSCA